MFLKSQYRRGHYLKRGRASTVCRFKGGPAIFLSIFMQRVNGSKKSILNWVIKLSLIELPMKLWSSKKNYCSSTQTMCKLCFCSQRLSEMNFLAIWRTKLQKCLLWCPPWEHLMEIFKYVNSKETESLAKTTVYKSAWIKAWGLGNKEGGSLRGEGW